MVRLKVRAPNEEEPPRAEYLVPARFAKLFGPPPVIFGESEEEFDEVWGQYIAEIGPGDFIEHQWVRDIAEASWEVRRYRAFITETVRRGLPGGGGEILSRFARLHDPQSDAADQELMADTVLLASLDDPQARRDVDRLLKDVNLPHAALTAAAFRQQLGTISEFQAMASRAESRRDRLMRDLTQRRLARGRGLTASGPDVIDASEPLTADRRGSG